MKKWKSELNHYRHSVPKWNKKEQSKNPKGKWKKEKIYIYINIIKQIKNYKNYKKIIRKDVKSPLNLISPLSLKWAFVYKIAH